MLLKPILESDHPSEAPPCVVLVRPPKTPALALLSDDEAAEEEAVETPEPDEPVV
jgi:hypothetical protein